MQTRVMVRLLRVINALLTEGTDVQSIYDRACELAVEEAGLRMAWVGGLDSDDQRLVPIASAGETGDYIERLNIVLDGRPEARGPAGRAVALRRPEVVNDIAASEAMAPWRQGALAMGYASVAAFPLQVGQRLFGVWVLYSAERGFFQEEAVEVFDTLSVDLAMAAYRREEEDHLRLLSAAVEQSPAAVEITDTDYRIIYVNEAFARTSGYPKAEVLGRNPSFLQSGKTPGVAFQDLHDSLKRGVTWRGEFINRRRDGSEFTERATIAPVRNHRGQTTHYLAVKENVSELRQAYADVERLAYYDTLTGLPSKHYFVEKLTRSLEEEAEGGTPLAVLCMDLNRFKEVNDTYGHPKGDDVLYEVARRLGAATMEGELLSRWSADEFALLAVGTGEREAVSVAGRLRDALARPVEIDGQDCNLGMTVGIACWSDDTDSVVELVRCAEIAMYRAKSEGRSCCVYHRELGNQAVREFRMGRSLEDAVANERFYLAYQPKQALGSERLRGAEALLRWEDPEFGTVSPAEFIPLAELRGMMPAIGRWVVREGCRQLREWQEAGTPLPGRLAVNISTQQIEEPRFVDELITDVAGAGMDPKHIELEVTESLLMRRPEEAAEKLRSLVALGFSVAIDDFGTGYSSLAYLKNIDARALKIDRSFIRDMLTHSNALTIVRSVIDMAHRLGLTTVAEGIETRDQALCLRRCGCDVAQGFYYDPPLPAEVFRERLNRESKTGGAGAALEGMYLPGADGEMT